MFQVKLITKKPEQLNNLTIKTVLFRHSEVLTGFKQNVIAPKGKISALVT